MINLDKLCCSFLPQYHSTCKQNYFILDTLLNLAAIVCLPYCTSIHIHKNQGAVWEGISYYSNITEKFRWPTTLDICIIYISTACILIHVNQKCSITEWIKEWDLMHQILSYPWDAEPSNIAMSILWFKRTHVPCYWDVRMHHAYLTHASHAA